MKVEMINQNQMRVVFKAQDLKERNINTSDMFSQNNNKVQELFREITAVLQDEYGFTTFGTPLMFEATMAQGVFSVVVTRVAGSDEDTDDEFGDTKDNLMADFYNLMKNIPLGVGASPGIDIEGDVPSSRPKRNIRRAKRPAGEYVVFSFKSIDETATAASFVEDGYIGSSRLFKMNGKYMLLLQNRGHDVQSTKRFEKKLGEFGQKEITSQITLSQMKERGEVVIATDAVNKLKLYSTF